MLFAVLGVLFACFARVVAQHATALLVSVDVATTKVGFGPAVIAGRKLRWNALPLWASIELVASATKAQRVAVALAGPVVVYALAAWLAFAALSGLDSGEPIVPPTVGYVTPASAAERGGVHPGDVLVSADGQALETFDAIVRHVEAAGTERDITLVVDRRGTRETLQLRAAQTELGPRLGITPENRRFEPSFDLFLLALSYPPRALVAYVVTGLVPDWGPKGVLGVVAIELGTHEGDPSFVKAVLLLWSGCFALVAMLLVLPIPGMDGLTLLRVVRPRAA